MIKPTTLTWILVVFGFIFVFIPMLIVQLMVAIRPDNQNTKDIVIGKGEDYHDKSHSRMIYGLAWADLLIWLPLLLVGSIGVVLGYGWGYILWGTSGVISIY